MAKSKRKPIKESKLINAKIRLEQDVQIDMYKNMIRTLHAAVEKQKDKQALCFACGIAMGMLIFEILDLISKFLGV